MQKIKNFVAINGEEDLDTKLAALQLFCAALGLDEDMIMFLHEKISERYNEDSTNTMFVGALMGLAIAEHGIENYEQRT